MGRKRNPAGQKVICERGWPKKMLSAESAFGTGRERERVGERKRERGSGRERKREKEWERQRVGRYNLGYDDLQFVSYVTRLPGRGRKNADVVLRIMMEQEDTKHRKFSNNL